MIRAARDGNLQTRRTGKLWLTAPAAVDAYLKGAHHRRGPTPLRRPVERAPASSSPAVVVPPLV